MVAVPEANRLSMVRLRPPAFSQDWGLVLASESFASAAESISLAHQAEKLKKTHHQQHGLYLHSSRKQLGTEDRWQMVGMDFY